MPPSLLASPSVRMSHGMYDKGAKRNRNIYGPQRPDEEAAMDDLDFMRAVASGMSRVDGFAAMTAEAERLLQAATRCRRP